MFSEKSVHHIVKRCQFVHCLEWTNLHTKGLYLEHTLSPLCGLSYEKIMIPGSLQSRFHSLPVNVLKEGLYVVSSLQSVINHKGMLKNVHYHKGVTSCRM